MSGTAVPRPLIVTGHGIPCIVCGYPAGLFQWHGCVCYITHTWRVCRAEKMLPPERCPKCGKIHNGECAQKCHATTKTTAPKAAESTDNTNTA